MSMTSAELAMLEVLDTGPCFRRELVQCAPDLINEAGTELEIRPSSVPNLLDRLNGLGYIGVTGSRAEVVIASELGKRQLNVE